MTDARTAQGNVDMDTAWNGVEGLTWAAHHDRYDAAVQQYHLHLLAGAAIEAGDGVLDIGCGCGKTTRDAARAASSGSALGVDLSGPMLERARQLAADEGLANVEFAQADAQVFPFEPAGFDVVTSRFGVMFFADRPAAFANIAAAARPGARLAFVCWLPLGENEWLQAIRGTLAMGRDLPEPVIGTPGPFGLADPDATRELLHDAGFVDVDCTELREPLVVGTDADDAFEFVSKMAPVVGLLNDLDDPTRAAALEQLRASLVEHTDGGRVVYGSAAWLVTARRA